MKLLEEGAQDQREMVAEACRRTAGTNRRETIMPEYIVQGGKVVEVTTVAQTKTTRKRRT